MCLRRIRCVSSSIRLPAPTASSCATPRCPRPTRQDAHDLDSLETRTSRRLSAGSADRRPDLLVRDSGHRRFAGGIAAPYRRFGIPSRSGLSGQFADFENVDRRSGSAQGEIRQHGRRRGLCHIQERRGQPPRGRRRHQHQYPDRADRSRRAGSAVAVGAGPRRAGQRVLEDRRRHGRPQLHDDRRRRIEPSVKRPTMASMHIQRRQHGFSIIEIMVGVVIGMIAVLVIYQVFATSEGIKRNITAAGDAQQNGLLSSFMLGIEIANAGNGLAVAAQDLGSCTPAAAMKDSLRPIPLLITTGANDDTPDSFVVYYSVARTLLSPALIQTAPDVNTYTVQSTNGFKKDDVIVAVSNPSGAGPCYSSIITDPVPAPDAVTGVVTITHSAVAAAVGATLVNLGPAKLVQKMVYDVNGGNLRSTSLLDANGAPSGVQASNPIASNIVNMKIQYGIDDVGDGLIHHWVPGISGTAYGDWDPATLLA